MPRADVLRGGSPCTDLSAGARAGMTKDNAFGTGNLCPGAQELRPHLVVWENVLGATSARAFSLEQRDGRVGGRWSGSEHSDVYRDLASLV